MAMATALRRAAPPVARPRLARGPGTAAAKKCPIAASRGVSAIVRAYGDRRRNDDAPRGGGGWTNEFGDEYDAIDDDDGYFEERRAPAGRPDRGRAPDRGRRFDDDRRRGGFGRAEVGDLQGSGDEDTAEYPVSTLWMLAEAADFRLDRVGLAVDLARHLTRSRADEGGEGAGAGAGAGPGGWDIARDFVDSQGVLLAARARQLEAFPTTQVAPRPPATTWCRTG